MYALNTIQIIGYISKNIESRTIPSGSMVADFTLAIPTITEGPEKKMIYNYMPVTLWRKLAEIAQSYCKIGTQIYVQGHLETDTWKDDQNRDRSRTKIIGESMIILSPKGEPHSPLPETLHIASGVNSVSIIGNITRDIELRTTPQGSSVTSFGVATNRSWKDQQGNTQERTEYHNVVVWGDMAEIVSKHLAKGRKIYLEGRLQNRSYETPTGEKRYITEIVARDIKALGHTSPLTLEQSGETPPLSSPTPPNIEYAPTINPDDLPF